MSDIDMSREAVERLANLMDDDARTPVGDMLRALLSRAEANDALLRRSRLEVRDDEIRTLMAMVQEARAELSALRAQMAWQPIETAPRDRNVIVCIAGVPNSQGEAWWQNGMWKTHDGIFPTVTTYTTPPTHWRPLPTPPEAP